MTEQDNIKAANSVYEAWNSGNLKLALPYQAEDYRYEAPGASAPMDRDQSMAFNQNLLSAFPDSKFKIMLYRGTG